MKKYLVAVLALSILLSLFCIGAAANKDYNFNALIEASSDTFNVGDEFYIKLYITERKIDDGLIGYQFSLKYDPSIFEVVENEDGTFAEETLPESWNEGSERIEMLEKDSEGKQTGVIKLVYIAPLESDDLAAIAIKDESFFVNIKFKCKSASDHAAVSFDGNDAVNCTAITEEGTVYNVKGKTTELQLAVKSDKSGIGSILIYIAAAVVAAGVIAAAAVIIKKKHK